MKAMRAYMICSSAISGTDFACSAGFSAEYENETINSSKNQYLLYNLLCFNKLTGGKSSPSNLTQV